MAYENIYEIEMGEDHLRRFIKSVVDEYEAGLHKFGSYDAAVAAAQDKVIETMSAHALMSVDTEGQTKH